MTSLKENAQTLLKHIGFYHRLKASRLYDFYWTFVDPHWIADRDSEVKFYRETLVGFHKGDVIFDIGANDGTKTDVFLRLGARVISIEPDETNVETLSGKFLKNRLFPKPVVIESKAVSDQIGQTTMWVESPGSALNTLNPKWAEALTNDDSRFRQHFQFTQKKRSKQQRLKISSPGMARLSTSKLTWKDMNEMFCVDCTGQFLICRLKLICRNLRRKVWNAYKC